jgi:hypothetical protein
MKTNKRLVFILDVLFLAALFWVVRYWHSRQFGLYEDDLTIIPDAFTQSFSSLISYIFFYITHMYGHSRPLSDSFIYLFSWIGWRTIGLWGPYLVGYLITAINISLFYWLIRRVANRPFALLAGLGYLLYSADTTQAFLTHSLGLQPSIMLIMLALHSYLSNKRILAYGLAIIVFFSYETPFLLFVAAPMLKKTWNKALLKEILWHVVVLIGMLGFIYIFRASIGEGRVGNLGLKDMLITPILHVLQGPVVSMGTFAYRPYQTIRSFNVEIGLAVLVSFAVFIWIISRLSVTTQVDIKDLWRAVKDPFVRRALPEDIKSLGRFFITGIIMLVAAYPLTFTVRAYAISGRDTRVHAAGVAGAALLVASFALILIYLTHGSNWRKLVNVLISLELALMVGYGFVIQHDYVLAWQYQREFWTELLPLISDAGDGTIVLIDPAALHDTRQIGANYWNLPRVLNQLYIFPEDRANIPVVYRLENGWQDFLVAGDGQFLINSITVYSVIINEGEYQPANTILIQAENGQLVRRADVELNGQDYQLKPFSEPILPGLPHGFLYPFLITEP